MRILIQLCFVTNPVEDSSPTDSNRCDSISKREARKCFPDTLGNRILKCNRVRPLPTTSSFSDATVAGSIRHEEKDLTTRHLPRFLVVILNANIDMQLGNHRNQRCMSHFLPHTLPSPFPLQKQCETCGPCTNLKQRWKRK